MEPRKLYSATLVALLLLGLAVTAGTAVLAQIAGGRIVEIKTPKIYPGEPVVVSVEVFIATTYTVKLCPDLGCTVVWASVSRYASVPGVYDTILTLPEKLDSATDANGDGLIDLYVVLEIWGTLADYKETVVYPKTVVTPPSTTIVDPTGTPQTVTVKFLGYLPGDTVNALRFEGPYTGSFPIAPVTIGDDGTGSTTVNLLALTGRGLPRGTYKVLGLGVSTDTTEAKKGSLEIRPQVVLTPSAGNGRCDASVCELTGITVTGYGFAPEIRILKIELFNINFTNVRYTFSMPLTFVTDEYGYFTVTNLKPYIGAGKGTNMTAGLYIPIVYEAPLPVTLTNTSTIDLKKVGTVTITESAVLEKLGTRASVKVTSYVDGEFVYELKATNMTYVKTEVLRIDIPYAGKLYRLAASLTDGNVLFALYNITTIPYVLMFQTTVTPTYDPTTGANVAHLSFNITPTAYVGTPPPTPGAYRFWATFYDYPNQLLLTLKEYTFSITKANATLTYTNRDTGTTVSRYYEYPKNMSVVDYRVRIPTLTFTDANIRWTVSWCYDATTKVATLTLVAEPLTGPSFEFRNVYYIVRPLLIVVAPPGILYPGDTVTMAAYGYAPGARWGHIPPGYDDNYLDVYWEKIVKLGTFRLGKDGNLTFKVTIPKDATFGVHYIWGVDKWGYEYTLAIVIGAKAYWYTGKVTPEVFAGLDGKRVEVCPCPESVGVKGLKYCAQCAVYTGECDYLGDIVKVVIYGLSPGEILRIYFGGILVKTVKVNASTEEISFVVPTLPEDTYTITAVGTMSGSITVDKFFNTTKLITASPKVVPKLLILDLNKNVIPVIVGSGFVRVVGTGFPVGASIYAVLFNGTDAAYTLNAHVTRWVVDSSGKLTSPFTRVLGIYVPVVEPGAYAVSLVYALPDGTTKEAVAGYVYVINNISILATTRDVAKVEATLAAKIDAVSTAVGGLLTAISSKIDAAVTELRSRIDAATTTITSKIDSSTETITSKVDAAVGTITSKIDTLATSIEYVKKAVDDLSKALTTVSSDVKALSTKIDAVSGKVDTVSSKIDTLKGTVDAISGTLKTVAEKLSTVETALDTVKSDVVAAKSDIATLKTDITTLKSDVAGLKSDLATVKSDVTSAKADISTLKSDVAGIKDVSGKVDTASMATYVAIIFALLAFIMATLAYLTLRKSVAPR